MTTKVLNLYAGIGGNRKLWEDVDVTAVEWDEEKAEVYRDHFPEDTVVETDAHEFLRENYSEYDFIWTSPPCPTHSRTNTMSVLADNERSGNHTREFEYPDMKLYQEIILLENFADCDYAVENVISYYEPLIEPQTLQRHYFWSNAKIPQRDFEKDDISRGSVSKWERQIGLSVQGLPLEKRRKAIRNCVKPELGKHVFEAATKYRQSTLIE